MFFLNGLIKQLNNAYRTREDDCKSHNVLMFSDFRLLTFCIIDFYNIF